MSVDQKSYQATFDVEFTIEPGTDIVNWLNPDTGKVQHRMEGIYPNIITEDQIKEHWAYNLLVNGVKDASSLDGWADLPSGTITFDVLRNTFEIEENF